MRLLTAEIDSEFARVLKNKRVQRVDIATAWATEGPGLDALERAAKRRKKTKGKGKGKVRVRALVGIEGDHTTPDALKRLCELGEVRLIDDNRLFHVKLYLFHRANTSSAWIGSANFTGRGFRKNEEVLLETTNAAEAVDWFKNRWKKVDADWSRRRLEEYCKTWKPPTTPPPDGVDEPTHLGADDRIIFVQKGGRPPPLDKGGKKGTRPRGTVIVAGQSFPYRSAQQAMKIVLDELQRRDDSFLGKCDKDEEFHRDMTHFIARTKEGLGTRHFRRYAKKIGDGWGWMSTQTQTQEKWELIQRAAKNAKLRVKVKGEYWEAESNARVKVGF